MPELPEVQTVVNDLNKKIIGRRISGVWFDTPKIIKKPKPEDLGLKIKGLRITEVKRRGKNILIGLSQGLRVNGQWLLLIHQKMTGHLLYGKWRIKKVSNFKFQVSSLLKGPFREKVNDYIHLIFYLDNGMQLALSDLRKFAKVLLGTRKEIENLPELQKMGPEPLDKSFKVNKFVSLISLERRKIKQVLMDPYVIAGIGNIYSDDILWQAKIHPLTPTNQLTTNQLNNLYVAMRQILRKALKLRGTSISDFRDTSGKVGFYGNKRLVYQREDEPCRRCGTEIKRIKIGGRSSCFCPKCQRM